jgi:hypothetical protein
MPTKQPQKPLPRPVFHPPALRKPKNNARLTKSFMRIKESELRRRIVDLVREIAGHE